MSDAPTAKQSSMRRFVMRRTSDVSGVSGTGIVAEGVEFSNGSTILRWLSQFESVEICSNMHVLEQIHGHSGATTIEWIDP